MSALTLRDRVEYYKAAFPKWPGSWPVIDTSGVRPSIYAAWCLGQDYRNKSTYYGAYPGNFLDRLAALYPDQTLRHADHPNASSRVLHAFSGSLPAGPYTRCDLVQESEMRCSIYDLDSDSHGKFTFICADPPYTAKDATLYGTPMVNRAKAMRSLARVAETGAHLA